MSHRHQKRTSELIGVNAATKTQVNISGGPNDTGPACDASAICDDSASIAAILHTSSARYHILV